MKGIEFRDISGKVVEEKDVRPDVLEEARRVVGKWPFGGYVVLQDNGDLLSYYPYIPLSVTDAFTGESYYWHDGKKYDTKTLEEIPSGQG